ncbi:MAG: TolC family protein [Sphingomonadaceae bacterium]|nr:TolC family protein [Sphingomonadaceae bacterium]
MPELRDRTLPLTVRASANARRRSRFHVQAICLIMPLLLSACISMAPAERVPEVVAQLPQFYDGPQSYDGTAATADDYKPAAWWRDFEDPTLNGLIDDAFKGNLDIAEAAARTRRARAQARLARSALFPAIDANAGASYSDSSLAGSAFGGLAGGAGIDRLEIETYSAGLGASYELDLFGRNHSDLKARRADAIAAGSDLRAVRLATAAQAISIYFEIVDARQQIELALRNSDVLADRVNRTEDRYQRGLVQSFELYQVRQQLRDVQASLPLRETALNSAEGSLAVLLGIYPEQLRKKLPGPLRPRLTFEPVPQGLPSALLSQRPDVHAASLRLESARHSIGARRAERFPSLRLGGSIGGQGGTPDQALSFGTNWAASLAGNIVAPIIDGGRISANIAAARATYDERAAIYARTVLNAFREVSSASAAYDKNRQRYGLIMAQHRDAKASLDLQAQRFQSGVGSYIAYLDALLAVQRVRSSLSAAGRDVALSRLGVHRALGGDWAEHDSAIHVKMIKTSELPKAKGEAQ